MARYTCPSCGEVYNGKKCRNCLYENFAEEIAHGNHTHKGEPLVIDAPVRRPIPKKDPFGCPEPARKKKTAAGKKNPLIRFLLLLFVIYALLPMVRNWGLELEAREQALLAPAPEPVVQPEDMIILHQEADVTIFTSVAAFEGPLEDFYLYVENDSDLDVTISAGDVKVNGSLMPFSSLVCRARTGEIGKGWLELDADALEAAAIQNIQTLSFTLAAIQNGRILFTTTEIPVIAEGAL